MAFASFLEEAFWTRKTADSLFSESRITSVWVLVPRAIVYFPGENFLFPTEKSKGMSAVTLVVRPAKLAIERPRIMLSAVTMLRIGFFITPPNISNVYLICLSSLTEFSFILFDLRQYSCQSAVMSELIRVIYIQTDEICSDLRNSSGPSESNWGWSKAIRMDRIAI